MNRNSYYKQEINLKHHESAAKIDHNTGEIIEITSRPNNLPKDKEIFNPKGHFCKTFDKSWDLLLDVLNDVELNIAARMMSMIRMNSNSLAPLNDNTSMVKLAELFKMDRRKVKASFDKLLKLGVYAEFKFGTGTEIKHYWVLNPFIAFKGNTMSKALIDLFRETPFANLH